jgi:hypothetical protein
MLVLLVALHLCDADGPSAHERMTADLLRAIVVNADLELQRHRDSISRREPGEPLGTCFAAQPAVKSVKLSEVRRSLERFVTGPARQCYLASYFGCTIGDWVARAGVAQSGPAFSPHGRSKVVIVQHTSDRVVADVTEVETRLVSATGDLFSDDDPTLPPPSVEKSSRYTLTRDSKGHWRIYDRKPTFEWECRVR